jgi:simple sugar transport system ATP-binding protein
MIEPTAHPERNASAAAYAVEARGVRVKYGLNLILDDVSIAVPRGDARALVGRNGAGKSTLVRVLTGLLPPEKGTVSYAGSPAVATRASGAWRDRVACVYQRSTLAPTLSVAENLFINAHPERRGWIDWTTLRRKARSIAEEWELDVDVDTAAERLRVEQRQIVEIARALLQGARFIILDEPTAALETREIHRLFDRLNRLKKDGVTLLYISHHLQEVYDICDSVTVMRDGKVVADSNLSAMPKAALVEAMVGQEFSAAAARKAKGAASSGAPALTLENLSLVSVFENVSLTVAKGERVGLAGLGGSGKEEIGDVVAGLLRPTAGALRVDGARVGFRDAAAAQKAGVSYVPRDRRRRGILPQLSVAENLTVTIANDLGGAGFVRPSARAQFAERLGRSLALVAASIEQPVGELSGGNQQKVVMGRALASRPKALVLVYPTQGVDIASKEALFKIVDGAQEAGTGVLLISDDLDELRGCDRVLVVFKGRLT